MNSNMSRIRGTNSKLIYLLVLITLDTARPILRMARTKKMILAKIRPIQFRDAKRNRCKEKNSITSALNRDNTYPEKTEPFYRSLIHHSYTTVAEVSVHMQVSPEHGFKFLYTAQYNNHNFLSIVQHWIFAILHYKLKCRYPKWRK